MSKVKSGESPPFRKGNQFGPIEKSSEPVKVLQYSKSSKLERLADSQENSPESPKVLGQSSSVMVPGPNAFASNTS